MYKLNLQEVIDILRHANPQTEVVEGFGEGHSYRGHYDEIAFTPVRNTTAAEMLTHAKAMLGKTCPGYKGVNFTYTENTLCNIAEYGHAGSDDEDDLTRERLYQMLGYEA